MPYPYNYDQKCALESNARTGKQVKELVKKMKETAPEKRNYKSFYDKVKQITG